MTSLPSTKHYVLTVPHEKVPSVEYMAFQGDSSDPIIAPMLPASQQGFLPISWPQLTDCPKEPVLYPVLMFWGCLLTSGTSISLVSRESSVYLHCILYIKGS